jgi:hypothetical protein
LAVQRLAFSHDGELLASVADTTMKIWKAAHGEQVASFRLPTRGVRSLAFSGDRKLLAVATYGWLTCVSVDSGRLYRRRPLDHSQRSDREDLGREHRPGDLDVGRSGWSTSEPYSQCGWSASGGWPTRWPDQSLAKQSVASPISGTAALPRSPRPKRISFDSFRFTAGRLEAANIGVASWTVT